ncbi:MarR family transcriptional regulator [Catenulispora sp. NF23]|uniref:MarR family transcriptional regulator n=1 Tax=Catenulispora pinistramenti TaxID=2705254 RepID=A0ABS5L5E9_9ACTN|nr:MarR family transcriptional regulator [Catenulispora pinistramenti]MBS2537796.1 MarR family transcriptional regulator [Catenulispora pinistramenti]MBS2553536.1 MarR family transcriptional regulator [Catenulispora pinistramenti]
MDDDEMIEIAVLLRRAQLRKQTACEAALASFEMTLPQWGMLNAAATHPDSSTHALAQLTGQSDQAAGAVVTRLEQRGLVERRNVRGKAILHQATVKGVEVLRQCDRLVAQSMRTALSGFTDDEVHVLRDLLERLG